MAHHQEYYGAGDERPDPLVDALRERDTWRELANNAEGDLRRLRPAAQAVIDVIGWTINVPGCEDTVRIFADEATHRRAAVAVRDLAAALQPEPRCCDGKSAVSEDCCGFPLHGKGGGNG